jgi:photosystem II stability/assembly factor-like uncharacterized protein
MDESDALEQLQDTVYQLTGGGGVLFAARQTGLFCSLDGGQSWQDAFASLNLTEPLPTVAVALPPNFATGGPVFAGLAGGILRSTDGGATWETLPLPPPPPMIAALAFSPHYEQDGVIFAATFEDGVLFSSDRGGHWVAWNFGLLDLNALCLAVSPNFAADETVFVGTQSGIFRSTNGGRAWREVELPIGYEAVLSLACSPNFATDRTIWAGTEAQGLLASYDGGDTWQRLAADQLLDPINQIVIDPGSSQNILLLHSGSVLFSSDGGANWSPWQAEALADQDVSAIIAPQGVRPGAVVWLGTANGMVYCTG